MKYQSVNTVMRSEFILPYMIIKREASNLLYSPRMTWLMDWILNAPAILMSIESQRWQHSPNESHLSGGRWITWFHWVASIMVETVVFIFLIGIDTFCVYKFATLTCGSTKTAICRVPEYLIQCHYTLPRIASGKETHFTANEGGMRPMFM
jgi:hypothetical protein